MGIPTGYQDETGFHIGVEPAQKAVMLRIQNTERLSMQTATVRPRRPRRRDNFVDNIHK
jgi:hypothetical protein